MASRYACLLLMMLLVCLGTSTPALAQPLPAASDSRQVWIIRPNPLKPEFSVLHRSETERPGRVSRVTTLSGKLAPGGVAASSDGLWLVFDDNSIQSIKLVPQEAMERDVIESQNQPALPRGVILRSLAASSDNLWALVRVEDAVTLAAIDDPQVRVPTTQSSSSEKRAASRNRILTTRPATEPAATQATTEPAPHGQAVRADRLLVMDRDRWVKLPLPEDWPEDHQDARIITPPTAAEWPMLLVQPRRASAEGKLTLWAFRRHVSPDAPRGAWVRHVYQIPLPESQQHHFQAVVVEGQTVIGHLIQQAPKLEIGLWVLRPERLGQFGSITVDLPDVKQWRIIPTGQSVTLLATDSKGKIVSRRMELRGRLLSKEDVPIEESLTDPLSNSDFTILVSTFVIAVMLLVLFWKREGQGPAVQLPNDLELADLGRLAAGVVDLLPCILLAAQLTEIDVSDLSRHWPGRSGTWQAMYPGAMALGFYVLHTLIFELLFSRSLGKMIFGLRVVNFTGQRPKPTQIIIRNLLKPLDLIALPFLLLPVLWPYRQRLADLVAGTLVVNTKGQRDEEENERDRLDD